MYHIYSQRQIFRDYRQNLPVYVCSIFQNYSSVTPFSDVYKFKSLY